MIGLDTNVLVRFLAQDGAKQAVTANKLFSSLSQAHPAYITQVSLVELVWVMQGCYGVSKKDLVSILDRLFHTRELVIENLDIAVQALSVFTNSNAEFSDCIIECNSRLAGCTKTMTFDRNAANHSGMRFAE